MINSRQINPHVPDDGKNAKQFKQNLLTAISVVAILLLIPTYLVHREDRRRGLNHDLIKAIADGKFDHALQLLNQGADGEAHSGEPAHFSFADAAADLLNRITHKPSPISVEIPESALAQLLFSGDAFAIESREAAPKQFEKLALALIDAGSPTKAKDRFGNTLLDMAVLYHDHALVKRLLAIDPRTEQKVALNLIRADNEDTLTLLLNGSPPNSAETDGETALYSAPMDKKEILLAHGADINATTVDGRTALLYECANGNDECAAMLLNHGASIEEATNKGITPFMMAAAHCRLEMVRRLAALGADVQLKTKAGDTALMFAVCNNDDRVLSWMLQQPIEINQRGTNGNTALSVAEHLHAKDSAERLRIANAISILKHRNALNSPGAGPWNLDNLED